MNALLELSATDLAKNIANKNVSCVDVMCAYLDHIEKFNPTINAIVALRPRDELIAEAHAADNTAHQGWLHGIPIAIKDLVNTAGLTTTYGSPAFAKHIPAVDDAIVQRIKAAGAIIIGKTNTPEFGLGSQSYNPVYGTTHNPYDVSKTAGGSSGGAAAALASRMLPIADGSDMMGSLRNPAAYCNVYGYRPTFGLVSKNPEGNTFNHQLATEGPMARNIRDIATLLDIISAPDHRLPASIAAGQSYQTKLNDGIKSARIGWLGSWQGHYPIDAEILTLCEQALKVFDQSNIILEQVTPKFDPEKLRWSWTTLRNYTIAAGLQELYNDSALRQLLKPEAIWEIKNGLSLGSMEIHAAAVIQSQWYACVATLFTEFDAIVLPSAAVFPFNATTHWPDKINGQAMQTYHQWMDVVIPASLAGLPALNVPVGFGTTGLPMGMQIISKRGNDAWLLTLGEVYHQQTHWPTHKPSLISTDQAI